MLLHMPLDVESGPCPKAALLFLDCFSLVSSEGLMLKLQYFGHLMQRGSSLEKTLMMGKIEDRRRGG